MLWILKNARGATNMPMPRRLYRMPSSVSRFRPLAAVAGLMHKVRAEKIRAKRKQTFFEQYVRSLAAEAKNIGITPAELQAMLAQASEKE